ncbi:MAG: hypothetical protein HKN94_14225 [Acidimicrobiales bacterium]|nr:hypothetical protein [Acidimicrobiales bacterium]
MGSANEDEDAPEQSSSPGWVDTSGSTDKTPGRIVAAALGEDIRRGASAEFPDPMPVVDITETPEVTETARASLIDLRREIDLINEEARVPESVAALASDDDLEAIKQRNTAGSAATSEASSTSPTDRVSVRNPSPQPAPATQAPVETPHVAPPVARPTDAVAPEDVFATHPYSEPDDVPLKGTTAPSGSSRTFALLTIALLLAVVSGVLGAMWVRERSISDDLRAELVIAEQPEDTSDLTAQLDGLTNEVATLEARNEQLEQQLARESALVPRVPEGRLEEIVIPFTPAYVGEVRGRFIAVDASGEYVVWGGGVEDEITDTGSLAGSPTGIFASREHAWIATDADVIEAVSLVGGDDLELIEAPGLTRLVRDARAFWGFVDDTRELQRFRQANGKRTTSVRLPVGVSELTVGAGAVWALGDDGAVYRVNTADFTMSPLDAGQQVIGIAGGADALWALSAADGSLRRVDAVTGEILVTVPVGRDPIDVVVSGNSVWVALRSGSSLIEVDTRTNAIVSRTTLPGTPTEITQGETGVLVTLEGDTPVVRVASLEE